MAASDPVIETEQLTKRYGDVTAVRDLDLTVRAGEIYGFLGPNGAGKTTTIHMLLSLVEPTSGTVRLFGDEPTADCRERIGVLAAHSSLYENLTAREHLAFVARVKDATVDPAACCERVGLQDAIDEQAGSYSTGMQQRLRLAMALVGEPDLLVLDEPTSGLDPNGARRLREVVRAESDRGTTVFFSSHILGQVERTCDRVGILDAGELVAEDTVHGLREQMDEENTVRVEFEGDAESVLGSVRPLDVVSEAQAQGRRLDIVLDGSADTNQVLAELDESAPAVRTVETETASLEALFASYTTGRGSA